MPAREGIKNYELRIWATDLHRLALISLNPYTLTPFPGHRSARGNEKGKKKKERGKRPPVPRYVSAGAEPLGNRLLPAGPQIATHKEPPFEGATGGKQCRELPKWLIGWHDFAPLTLNPYTLILMQPPSPTEEAPNTPFNNSTDQPFNFLRPLICTD